MSDIRLSMREFRLLEEKRKLAALSDAEERRWNELGQSLGIFEAGGSSARQNGAQIPVHLDGSSSQAPADEANGFAEVDPEDIMEIDPSEVLLVEPEGGGIASQAEMVALTQNFEWVPESAPLPAGGTAPEQAPLLSPEGSAETSAAEADPGPTSIPLTQNFEWVPESPAFESSAPQLPPEPQIASAEAVQSPPEQQIALDAPVIDLLDSDAMQEELQSNSWEADQAQPGNAASALAIEDLPPLEEAQIEPVAQWANEPPPPPQESPTPVEAPAPQPPEPRLPYAADSTSATGYTQVASSEHASASFQFEINEALVPPAPPAQAQPEEIAEAPAGEEHEAQVAPARILLGGAAAAPPARADPETSFENIVPIVEANNRVNSAFVAGEHRVVVHLIDGQVKRGTVQDLDLTAGSVPLQSAPGVVDNIATDRLKAIFFMLAPGSPKTTPSGQKIRLTLQDGREVVGFSEDFKTGNPGFFLRPADERTNTARIFVPRWSVYSIDEQ